MRAVTPGSPGAATVAVARRAMHTRFEILLHGEDPIALRAAGEQALDEIDRLEAQLSLYRPTSEIAQVNRQAANAPVRVSPNVFRLLAQAKALSQATAGAFDPTVGPLVKGWGFLGGDGRMADPAVIQQARECVGLRWVELDAREFTVRFPRPGFMLDLGAIGKGYAIDVAVEALREAGVASAFLHGGTSSSFGLGRPPDASAWKAALPDPRLPASDAGSATATPTLIGEALLTDRSLGVSGIYSKSFRAGTRVYGHVLDPRLGEPVERALLAAVVLPSATETDALSTALLVLGRDGLGLLEAFRPAAQCLVVEPLDHPPGLRVLKRGW